MVSKDSWMLGMNGIYPHRQQDCLCQLCFSHWSVLELLRFGAVFVCKVTVTVISQFAADPPVRFGPVGCYASCASYVASVSHNYLLHRRKDNEKNNI
jgi:hypothetical protein